MRVEQRAPTDPLWSMVHAPLRSLAFKASNVPVGVGENGGERRVGSMGRAAGKAALAHLIVKRIRLLMVEQVESTRLCNTTALSMEWSTGLSPEARQQTTREDDRQRK